MRGFCYQGSLYTACSSTYAVPELPNIPNSNSYPSALARTLFIFKLSSWVPDEPGLYSWMCISNVLCPTWGTSTHSRYCPC